MTNGKSKGTGRLGRNPLNRGKEQQAPAPEAPKQRKSAESSAARSNSTARTTLAAKKRPSKPRKRKAEAGRDSGRIQAILATLLEWVDQMLIALCRVIPARVRA